MTTDWIRQFARGLGREAFRATLGSRRDIDPAMWGLEYHENQLALFGTKLGSIAAEYGTPIHVLNVDKLRENARSLTSVHGQARAVKPYFSYKTHPVPAVLQELDDLGFGAEVISHFELWLALKLGVNPKNIVYNGPAKNADSIRIAVERAVRVINVNNLEELWRIRSIANHLNRRANIGIRVALSGTSSGQFGFRMKALSEQAIISKIRECPEFNLIGFHCHLGSIFGDLNQLSKYLNRILDALDFLHEDCQFHPDIVNIGGGFGIPTVRTFSGFERWLGIPFGIEPREPHLSRKPSLDEFAKMVTTTLSRYFESSGRPVPELAVEPGRSISGNCQALLTSVVEIQQRKGEFTYCVLDAGISVASILTTEFHQVLPVRRDLSRPRRSYRFVGPLCHTGDILYSSWTLPELRPGEILAIMDSGAYFESDARAFSFPRPGIVGLRHDRGRFVIRQSESFDDMIGRDVSCRSNHG